MISHRTPLLSASLGTQRDIVSFRFGAEGAGRKVYIQASLHADETPAMLTASLLRRKFESLEAEGRLRSQITLVPVANPIGLSQHVLGQFMGCFELNSARNFNRGIFEFGALCARLEGRLGNDANANRQIITGEMRRMLDEQQPGTEFDSLRLALQKLAVDADIVLDLHCSLEAAVHVYTSASAWGRIEPLARYLGSKAQLLSDDSDRGGFSEWTNRAWIDLKASFGASHPLPEASVAATIECRGERDVSYEFAEAQAQAIVAYLIEQSFVDGVRQPLPELLRPATQLDASAQFHAARSGVLVYAAQPGQWVRVGDAICDIVDPVSGETTTVSSHAEGVFYMRRAIRFVTAGAEIGRVTGRGPQVGTIDT